jgi:hypothetical protein
MNNYLHRSFFKFGIDLELNFREVFMLEFDRI